MMRELTRAPELGWAEALRRSMLALLADPEQPAFAHPAAWAPFVVVGEGRAPVRPPQPKASAATHLAHPAWG
jgi:hypothetical protein